MPSIQFLEELLLPRTISGNTHVCSSLHICLPINVYEAELFLASSFDGDITQKVPWCWFVLVYCLHHPLH